MTKDQYLKSLNKRLCFMLPAGETADILEEISLRFDEGFAEGLTEDTVCAGLGFPAAAAAEFLQNVRNDSRRNVKALLSLMAALLPAELYLSLSFFGNGAYGSPPYTVYFLPLLPPVVCLILKGKGWAEHLQKAPFDIPMAVCSLLMTTACVCCCVMINETMKSADSGDFLFMCICTACMLGAMAAWAVSLKNHGGKYALLFPLAGAGFAVWAAAVSGNIFGADAFYFQSGDFAVSYRILAGKYMGFFLKATFALSAACLAWAALKGDGLTLAVLSLLTGCCMGTANVYTYIMHTDPTAPDVPHADISVFIMGIVSAAFWLIFTLAIRGKYRPARKGGLQ
ncbi:MAG: DUF1700 domain-containing protein [Ruminococcus sp.]|nr:DUF1700 domain-containing protein [Ruminococcus sp.]